MYKPNPQSEKPTATPLHSLVFLFLSLARLGILHVQYRDHQLLPWSSHQKLLMHSSHYRVRFCLIIFTILHHIHLICLPLGSFTLVCILPCILFVGDSVEIVLILSLESPKKRYHSHLFLLFGSYLQLYHKQAHPQIM